MLTVAINNKVVLVANHPGTPLRKTNWSGPVNFERVSIPKLRPGDWMELKQGEIIDIDIVVGERPGGSFEAMLAYEKKGVNYPKEKIKA
ncbi:MAG: hypothetical protein HC904_17095 [Blastochloris sp.]|nr:hypothetical protein [Blastochloris sp.]